MTKIFRKKGIRRKKIRFGNLQHIGTICIVAIISFGLLGAAYAYWNQSFSIFGSISTGNINMVIRDITVESSDGYESCSFNPVKQDNVVTDVEMNVVTGANPFNIILIFTVENNGTIPVVCEGIDKSVTDEVEIWLLESPGKIDPGQTANIKVKLTKGYCENFEFSSFVRYKQAT